MGDIGTQVGMSVLEITSLCYQEMRDACKIDYGTKLMAQLHIITIPKSNLQIQ